MVKTTKLSRAQNTLWDLLSAEEKEQQAEAYKVARKNLENGITETIIDSCKVANNAPDATYFSIDDSLITQPNIVGEVRTLESNGDNVVVFESKDIIALLELYYGYNILIYIN